MRYYLCPVCGYDKLDEPPVGFTLCSCCGTEFELDDDEVGHDVLRMRWIRGGKQWWSPVVAPPIGWNADRQLRRAGHETESEQFYSLSSSGSQDFTAEKLLANFSPIEESRLRRFTATAAA